MMREPEKETKIILRRTLLISAVLLGVFCGALAVLIMANALQLLLNPPLDSPVLVNLTGRLSADPSQETLREEIRVLQLLSRRAYFSRTRQIQSGAYLLLGGFVLLVLCLKGWARLSERPLFFRRKEQAAPSLAPILIAGALIFVLSAGAAGFSAYLVRFDPGDTAQSAFQERAVPDQTTSLENGQVQIAQGGFQDSAAPSGPSNEEMKKAEKHWPSFRGPWGLGISAISEPPQGWNGITGQGVIWKTPVPKPGFSSPVTWGNRVFLTGGDRVSLEVYCFDLADGTLLWSVPVSEVLENPGELPQVTEDTGYAASTMAVFEDRVFALFASGDLVSLDREGNHLWGTDLGKPDNLYGHSSSLLTYHNLLLVQYDHNREARLYAFDLFSGEEVWRVDRDVVTSWASPVIAESGAETYLVLTADPYVIAYNPLTGGELWRADCMGGEVAVSPAFDGERVYVANQYAVAAAIDIHNGEILWEDFFDLPDVSSPIAMEGLLFMATSYGIVTCREGITGEILWEAEYDEGFYASPVSAGDIIYLTDRSGMVHLIRASRNYEPLSSYPLGEPSDSTPALTQNSILFRGNSHLYRIGDAP